MSAAAHPGPPDPGLCASCRHVRRIRSARNSVFFLCQRATSDPEFARYPDLPVHACPGHEVADVA